MVHSTEGISHGMIPSWDTVEIGVFFMTENDWYFWHYQQGIELTTVYSLTYLFQSMRFSETPIHVVTTRCVVFNIIIRQGRTR